VNWEYVKDTLELVETLKKEDIYIAAIEQAEQAIMLKDFKPVIGKKLAVVFGNEVKGVSQEVVNASNAVIEIPQFGTKHSLNIAVSAGLTIWDLFNKINP
jgi:tRNA G18 (ribose-2'-O)-methylase SpoU